MLQSLAETEAGVQHQQLPGHAARHTVLGTLPQIITDVCHHVVVAGCGLHGRGLALTVHDADGEPGFGRHRQSAVALQCTHIIDHAGTARRRFTHQLGIAGIHRDHHIQLGDDALEQWQDTVDLFLAGHGRGTGAGRLTTDIENVGPGVHLGPRTRHGALQVQGAVTIQRAPVGEGIRRGVDDPHDTGPGQIEQTPGTLQCRALGRSGHDRAVNARWQGRQSGWRRRRPFPPRPGRRLPHRRACHRHCRPSPRAPGACGRT